MQQLTNAIHDILLQQSLKFSDDAINRIVRIIKRHQQSEFNDKSRTDKKLRIQDVHQAAMRLLSMLKKDSLFLEFENIDLYPRTLEQFIQECKERSAYYKRPNSRPSRLSLKILVYNLIEVYEEQTGKPYILVEGNNWGVTNTQYDQQAHDFIKGVLNHVAPDEDSQEIIKWGRRNGALQAHKKYWAHIE